MSRVCTICTHPERTAIDKALIAQEPYRSIAEHFQLSPQAVLRHKADHVLADLVAAHEANRDDERQVLADELRRWMGYITKVLEACDRWLTDPDDATRYDLGPRAHEVMVHYEETDFNGDRSFVKRRKATLAALLKQAERADATMTITLVEHKSADPRKLIIDATARLDGHLRLLAELVGKLQTSGTVNILVSPEWLALRGQLTRALMPFPDARIAVASVLSEVKHAA